MTTQEQSSASAAAIYARTSSPNQRFNYSIEQQVNECWKYCNERGWVVRYVFVDECLGGETVQRAKLQVMLKKAEARDFNVIVFWKLDRLCRSLADLVNVEKTLRQWGVSLCSVTEFIDTTTSVGRFNFRNLASVAELEREQIGERARLGLYGLAREHKWPNPHPPLGYSKDTDGRLILDKGETHLVRRIFQMYLQTKSMPEVAFRLKAEGVPTKKRGRWNARAVRDVLTNEIYVGKYRVAAFEEQVEECRIVTEDAFSKARETMLRYKTGAAARPRMPVERRSMAIEQIHKRYLEFLGALDWQTRPGQLIGR